MNLMVEQSTLRGEAGIPGSKSHTIRAVAIASLAEGESVIGRPLDSADAAAAVRAYSALGAAIEMGLAEWRVRGTGGNPTVPENVIDVANSGTTMRLAMGSCALSRDGYAVLTGDAQVRRRPCGPLAQSLTDLGAQAWSTRGAGCPPLIVRGGLKGGVTEIEAVTSQYLSSLLLNAPLADGDSHIRASVLNERPYVEMTLDWLSRQGIAVDHDDCREFHVPGRQRYRPVRRDIPADWSSATFFAAAGALPGNEVTLTGLDLNDTQGDRAVLDYVRAMGAAAHSEGGSLRVSPGAGLRGCEIDLNATPDALPMMAALACFAEGTTRLVNVPQARLKETDRIAVMREELTKLGGHVEEMADGLVVHGRALKPGTVEGHDDHRVVMALAIAATAIPGETVIRGCEAVSVTFPGFVDTLAALGGSVRMEKEEV